MTDQDDRRPIYRRLSDQLAADIVQNRLHPGDALPTETQLAAKHQVALGTVRKALDCLANDRLIERIHGVGTFVRRPNFGNAFDRFIRFIGPGGDQRISASRILSRDTLVGPQNVTKILGLVDNATVIRLRRLRIHNKAPVLSEEIWLDESRFQPILTMEDNESNLLYPIYENLCGEIVAHAEETITIETANDTDVELLGLVFGTPVVVIERLALGYNDYPIEWRRSRGSAAEFRYKIDIR